MFWFGEFLNASWIHAMHGASYSMHPFVYVFLPTSYMLISLFKVGTLCHLFTWQLNVGLCIYTDRGRNSARLLGGKQEFENG